MGSLCDYAENKVLDHILKTASYTPPTTVYLAFFTADPTDAGVLTNEATYTGYARKSIPFGAAATRAITQNAQVDFDACGGGSNTISHWGLMDGDVEGAGNMLAYGAFTTPKVVSAGYTPFVASAEIQVNFSAGAIATAFANTVLDWLFRAQSLSQPTNVNVALFSTACGDAAAGTELTGNGYARKACNVWDAAAAGASENTGAINFDAASGDWSAAVYAALYLDTTYAIYLDINDLTVLSGEIGRFIAGALDVTLA